ncbi:MAG: winged helix-turn-helix transcriptional regulator [Nitrospirae bacterium]|nr:winged helix-turn-helix transcriptional regulator [Nitrospirota bacterium]
MGTRYKGARGEVRALNAFINLVRAAESVVGRLTPVMDEAGLTVSQFGALETLFHLGPMCQRELGAKLLKTGGNITMVVNNLERRGLVTRLRSGEDRRRVTVRLTGKGGRLIARVFPVVLAGIVREMGLLGPAEQEELRRLCRIVGKRERTIGN